MEPTRVGPAISPFPIGDQFPTTPPPCTQAGEVRDVLLIIKKKTTKNTFYVFKLLLQGFS